jgi:hypothetical protein
MVKEMTAVVAAAGPHRGIGYQGQMVRFLPVVVVRSLQPHIGDFVLLHATCH